jgi:hypothetical protein
MDVATLTSYINPAHVLCYQLTLHNELTTNAATYCALLQRHAMQGTYESRVQVLRLGCLTKITWLVIVSADFLVCWL